MVPESTGWFVKNVQDATWVQSPSFGMRCRFEPTDTRWPGTGVGISVLQPGKSNCLYHRENAQEDFLVLSGECLLLVNGEEQRLRAWDFVHCPPGVNHVFIGAGNGPCAILMMGDRPADHQVFYPHHERAQELGVQSPVETPDPKVAYASMARHAPCDAPDWPLDGGRPHRVGHGAR